MSAVEHRVSDCAVTLTGFSADGDLAIESMSGAVSASAVASGGVFSIDVDLAPGLNRLRLFLTDASGVQSRSWVGNSIEVETVAGAPTARGATLDIVCVP